MSPHEKDDLTRLLHDAVDDLEPRSGFEAIRARTSLTTPAPAKESPVTNIRTWFLGGLGAAVATAAVIGGVMLVGNNDPSSDPGPVDSPSPSITELPSDDPTTATPEPTETDTTEPVPPQPGSAIPVYYVGDSARGLRLYREFHANPDGQDKVDLAVAQALGSALDPDYRTGWPAGTGSAGVEATPDLITIDLTGDVHDRPAGLSAEHAQLAIEQLIYTAQAAYGQGRVPVQFLLNGGRTDQLLGQPASEPLANGPVLDTLALVNISTPSEGATISGTLELTGVGSSFEATFGVKLQRFEGTEIVLQEPVMSTGVDGTKLFPFTGSFDISDVAPGKYVLSVSTDDPSGGAEGFGPDTDTKVITIR